MEVATFEEPSFLKRTVTCDPDIVARPAVLRDAPVTLVSLSYLMITSPVDVLTVTVSSFASTFVNSPVAVIVCADDCDPD